MIGGIIIGDEIMRGKREDKHFRKLIELLAARGLKLDWAQYLGDSPALITETLRRSLATPDIVFCFGGIGATPDDHTRQCAAAAVGVDLALHAEAEAEIRARFGDEATPQRLKMGEFPVGSEIIPNPFNRIPGFSIRNHWFVPGFPQMAWPMLEWVLDHFYASHFASGAHGKDPKKRHPLPGGTKRDLPAIGFNRVHDERGNQDDREGEGAKPYGGLVDLAGPDMPHEETEREKSDTE